MEETIERLKRKLVEAKETIRIASPWVDAWVLEELLKLVDKEVKVEVILRAGERKDLDISGEDSFRVLRKYGAELYLNPRLHAKMVIVDADFALVGSANLTRRGMMEDGNLESVLFIEDRERIRELIELFESYKEVSYRISKDAVAVVIALSSSLEVEVLLLEDIKEQSFLKAELGDSILLCKLLRVYTGEFERELLRDMEEEPYWLLSYLITVRKSTNRFGKLKLLLQYGRPSGEKEGYFSTPLKNLHVGQLLFQVGEDDVELEKIMKTNLSGYAMDVPVRVGNLLGKPVKVYVDLMKIANMHMAVLGTTGSGKTTFVRRLLENMPSGLSKVFIFDLFGEYKKKLKIDEERLHHVEVPHTLLPLSSEDVRELFRDYGLSLHERGEQEREFLASIRRHLKPDLRLCSYKERGLEDILKGSAKGELREEVEDLLLMLSRDYGEDSLKNQPEVFRLLQEALVSHRDLVILDLRELLNPITRLNLVGLLLKEILYLSREGQERRFVVLEEAQNFVPERGVLDVPAGRENLAAVMTKRIVLEGRKLGLGLVAVSQRPANISKYVLSQLNTQAVFRLITQNDIDAVSQFFEYPYEDQIRLLPSLKPGNLFLSGIGVPFSMLLEIEL
ncbi:MAG: DUF87 domain-containing protein [Acidobacteria bacterium]|jgi:tRNA A37 threonylcarbamoyladenosine biosynthesis protein TsaE|nr:MAG: DUF87 domain-containing protein [Acidobacteriota bacterium]